MIKDDVSKYFKIFVSIITLIGLISNFIIFNSFTSLLYYTILSNLFVFIFYTIDVLFDLNKNKKYHMTKGLMLLSILCTMIIYNFSLASKTTLYEGHAIICSVVHIVVPLLVLIECLFFEVKKELEYKYVFYWLVPLIIYFITVVIFGLSGGTFLNGQSFPYDFLNANKYGLLGCGIRCVVILTFYIVLSVIIVFIDNKIKDNK